MKTIKTMIIENNVCNALFYESCGVDRIFIDLESMGKQERQGHLNTFISTHKLSDLEQMRDTVTSAQIITRVNPINSSSKKEIEEVISFGTDLIMLPMFKSEREVRQFIQYVKGRAKVSLLLETPEASKEIDKILEIKGIDEIHIGLNDLHIGLNLKFMFELLKSGFIDSLVAKIQSKSIPYGIGGVAALDSGAVNGKLVMQDYARLGSSCVILSRSFKELVNKNDFKNELGKIIDCYESYFKLSPLEKSEAQKELHMEIKKVVEEK